MEEFRRKEEELRNEVRILCSLVRYLKFYINDNFRITQTLLKYMKVSEMKRTTIQFQSMDNFIFYIDLLPYESDVSVLINTHAIYNRICKGGELMDEITTRGNFSEQDAAKLMK